MRSIRSISLALSLALSASLPMTASADAESASDLAQIEIQGLKAAGASRLKEMVAQPVSASASEVKYSTSWIDSQPKAEGSAEFRCLAEALYFEARGESVKGQFAVAEVIMNRVKSARFPGTLCGVINQGTGRKYQCQFTYTCDGHKEVVNEPRAWARVAKVARAIIDGTAPKLTDGATHYHTTAVNPKWARVYTKTARIGDHLFYRHTWKTASK
ncbi:cell wall hydrolase [Sulfitobacter sp. PS-8MA]|uniref:cell wall hydrolase n=1 Tax=Sulfitobacter sp. PS-8MA TaxID=3237707 RepID=UPI0034C6752C